MEDFTADPSLEVILERLEKSAGNVGLYMQAAMAVVKDEDVAEEWTPNQSLRDVHDKMVIQTMFTVGDKAWSKRVQEPEQFKVDQEFYGIEFDVGPIAVGEDDEEDGDE